MLDIIGSLTMGSLGALIIGLLIALSRAGPAAKIGASAVAATWAALVLTAAAFGLFAPGVLGPLPAVLLPFGGLLALLFGSWFFVPAFRSALLSVPLPVLVGLNAGRIGGLFFLLLYFEGRLSAPFAQAAGIGDIAVGVLALPLAVMLARGVQPFWLAGWNVLGALDLLLAVTLGILSAPGTPLRVFTEGAGTLAMTALPWILVPTVLVPIFLLIHLTIAMKLRATARVDQPALA